MSSLFSLSSVLRLLRGKPLLSRRSRQWTSITLLTSSILIVATTAVTSYWLVRRIILDGVKTNALLTVEKAGDDIDQWLATRVAEVETLANQVAIRSMHLEAVIPFLSLEADRLPEYRFLMYAYPDGSHYRTDEGFVQDKNILSRSYFKDAIGGEISISGLVGSTANDPQQVSIAAPVWSVPPLRRTITPERAEIRAENLYAFGLPSEPYQKPKPIGALIGVIPINHIAEVVATVPKIPGSYAFVLDSHGRPIAQPDASRLPPNSNLLKNTDPVWKNIYQTMSQQQQGVQQVQVGDRWMYVAYAPLRQANWSLALVIPKDQVENQLDALNALAIVVAVVLVIATAIGFQQIRLLEQAEDRSAALAETNTKLQQEIGDRQRAEAALLESQTELENRVLSRTAELATANQTLQASEAQLKAQAQQLEQTLQELRQAQAQLVQTEKMSSLGQLVAGIAHEINNPVNFIHANLPYATQYTQDLIALIHTYQSSYPDPVPSVQAKLEEVDIEFLTEDLAKVLESMHIGTDRIRQLVLSLRNFSRLDEAAMKQVDIHEGLDNTLLILQNRLKPKAAMGDGFPTHQGIQIIKEYTNSHRVECYAGQLNQVFLNVLTNAIDALEMMAVTPDGDRPLMPVSPSPNASVGDSLRGNDANGWHHSLPSMTYATPTTPTIWLRTLSCGDDWVEIHIADNGPGMSEAIRHKIFDPFFTTKPVGKGTGIGLSISYQIVVEKHGGQLQCFSVAGAGTEFVMRIPVSQSQTKMMAPDRSQSQVVLQKGEPVMMTVEQRCP